MAGLGGCFFVVAGFRDVDFDARFFVPFVPFDFFAVFVEEVAAPDVTRDECLVRCRTIFLPAASAEPPMASAAMRERAMSDNRLRIIQDPPATHDTLNTVGIHKGPSRSPTYPTSLTSLTHPTSC